MVLVVSGSVIGRRTGVGAHMVVAQVVVVQVGVVPVGVDQVVVAQ